LLTFWIHSVNNDIIAGPSGGCPLLVLTRWVHHKTKKVNQKMENQTTTNTSSSTITDAWTMYIYSLKSPVSKQKYPKRLAKFFAFAGLPQDIPIEEQSEMFVAKATTTGGDTNWAFNTILKFVMAQLERVNRHKFPYLTVPHAIEQVDIAYGRKQPFIQGFFVILALQVMEDISTNGRCRSVPTLSDHVLFPIYHIERS
jgi:hypothetical protein